MTSRDAPLRFLSQIAAESVAGWLALGQTAYAGELSIATDNSTYRFRDGIFVSRAKKPARFFEAPKAMRGMLLIGLLHENEKDDVWSLGPKWQLRSHAVLWRVGSVDATSFILTSPTVSFSPEEPEPKPDPDFNPWVKPRDPSHSGVIVTKQRRIARPPSFKMPLPPSMTRLHPVDPTPPDR